MIMTLLRQSCVLLLLTSLLPAQAPVVNSGGIVNAASFTAPVAPGALISIFGVNLAPQIAVASQIPLPLSLAGVPVRFNNNVFAPLLFVSPTQVNAHLPCQVPSHSTVPLSVPYNSLAPAP